MSNEHEAAQLQALVQVVGTMVGLMTLGAQQAGEAQLLTAVQAERVLTLALSRLEQALQEAPAA